MQWKSADCLAGRALPFLCLALGGVLLSASLHAPAQTRDPYQRSTDVYTYQTGGRNGAERGESLYYYKCWICHNQYTDVGGPHLKGLFERGTFEVTGQPANDQTVRDKIRDGGPGMPRFATTMTEADIADLISYLKSSRCCFEGEEPPANPRFRAR